MAKQPNRDINKLPVWAQNLITRLEAELADTKQQVQFAQGKEPTNTYLAYQNRAPLPRNAKVSFEWGKGWPDDFIAVRIEDDQLQILGGRTLVIKPSVSNAVYISLE